MKPLTSYSIMRSLYILFLTCFTSTILAQQPINIGDTLIIGGIRQFITIKGNDNSKPVFLFLHGGPGGSVMNYSDRFTDILQEEFVVVQWDQRETGKTLELNSSPQPLTFELFQRDTQELIDSLLHRFKQKKLYLAGHSWGTAIGFQMAKKYAQLLYAWIAISPMINQVESEKILLAMMKEKAKRTKDFTQLEELNKIKIPFEEGRDLYYQRKWLFHFNNQKIKSFTESYALAWTTTWLTVWNEASAINLTENLPAIDCPVYFLSGTKDYQTNFTITENYFNKVKAPKKDLFWFEDTGHSIPYSKPQMLQKIIIEKILPETY